MSDKWKIKLKLSGTDGVSKIKVDLTSTAEEHSTVRALLVATLEFCKSNGINFDRQLSQVLLTSKDKYKEVLENVD